jgi:hypothetical protein
MGTEHADDTGGAMGGAIGGSKIHQHVEGCSNE